jgi:hypothetical protein
LIKFIPARTGTGKMIPGSYIVKVGCREIGLVRKVAARGWAGYKATDGGWELIRVGKTRKEVGAKVAIDYTHMTWPAASLKGDTRRARDHREAVRRFCVEAGLLPEEAQS